MSDNYTEVSNRSFNMFDLEHLVDIAKKAQVFVESTGARSFEAEIYDANQDYVLGVLWFDPESELIRFDPARYGES